MEQQTISIFSIESEFLSQKIQQAQKDYQNKCVKISQLKKKYNRNLNENNNEYYNTYYEMMKCHFKLTELEMKRTFLFVKMIDAVVEACKNGGYTDIVKEGKTVKSNLKKVQNRLKFILKNLKIKLDSTGGVIKQYDKNQNVDMEDVQSFMQSAIFYNKLNEQLNIFDETQTKFNIAKANEWQKTVWDRLESHDLVMVKNEKGWQFISAQEIEQIIE
ncbi:MAG: hypothetical protein E7379_03195 [Clostridiales bacterium]|nr:hypothetical protein [Clostridiales bacterium]